MKTLNRAAFAALLAFGFSSTAIAAEIDEVTITVDHPQSISVSAPLDVTGGLEGSVQSVSWTVTSNNGFRIAFNGDAPGTNGLPMGIPAFTKQDVDATGAPVLNSYDVLDTRWGVQVTGAESTQTGATLWGGGTTPVHYQSNADGLDLVGIGGLDPDPNGTIGTIMTGDTSGSATVALYAVGNANDGTVQSGNYSTTVTLTVTADEKLNP